MRDRLEPVCRRRRLDPLALCHRLGSGFTRSIDGACWRTVAGDGRHTRVQKLPEIRISRASPDLCGGRPVMAVPTAIRRASLEKVDVQADPATLPGKADTVG